MMSMVVSSHSAFGGDCAGYSAGIHWVFRPLPQLDARLARVGHPFENAAALHIPRGPTWVRGNGNRRPVRELERQRAVARDSHTPDAESDHREAGCESFGVDGVDVA